jgi:hypothetical protein
MVTLEYDVGGCGALLNIAIHPPLPALISRAYIMRRSATLWECCLAPLAVTQSE